MGAVIDLPFEVVHHDKSSLPRGLQHISLSLNIWHDDLSKLVHHRLLSRPMFWRLGHVPVTRKHIARVATSGFPLVNELQGEKIASEAPTENCCNLPLVVATTDFNALGSLPVHCPC